MFSALSYGDAQITSRSPAGYPVPFEAVTPTDLSSLVGNEITLGLEGPTAWIPPTIRGTRTASELQDDFNYDPALAQGHTDFLGVYLLHAYQLFSHPGTGDGLVRGLEIRLSTHGWLSDTSGMDTLNNKQGAYARSMTRALHAFLSHASNTRNPLQSGCTLRDSTLIVVTSEFLRTILADTENGYGGSQGMVLIGPTVRGGSYGDTDVSGQNPFQRWGTELILPFDRLSGRSLNPGDPRISEEDAYATILAAMGIPKGRIEEITGADVAPIPVMLR
jgi:hypothetical protein